ncbi:cysteine proteinase [Trypanosoma grayi]|uniref:cysteine proteinase n=1 Tax=Trypanosoma grayi TaxID=71804 RepID=UPI0004F47542|nr:cysteine proteinase [Trypanosoma grayi]KEG12550.1 cysteine proteinase [Trypanosoma grayi]
MSRLFSLAVIVALAALTASAALTATMKGPRRHRLNGYTFEQYLRDFGKSYEGQEYVHRKAFFGQTLASVRAHNAAGNKLYVMGINHMSDWAPEEFARLNGAKPRMMRHLARPELRRTYRKSGQVLPNAVDYRKSVPPILTAVKDQGGCGSCWAHGAVENMESHYAIVSGKLHVLSQQQLTSCTPNHQKCGGTGGCKGSTADLAYEYAMDGLTTEWVYPYTSYGGETGQCLPNKSVSAFARADSYVKIPSNDQEAVMEALANHGPLSVNVDASYWRSYSGGIFNGCDYGKNITINHVVQLVGYGRDEGLKADYWIIRNSWSPDWGENGYIRLLRTENAECGWDVDMQKGTACEGDPSVAWVCGECGMAFDASFPIMSCN